MNKGQEDLSASILVFLNCQYLLLLSDPILESQNDPNCVFITALCMKPEVENGNLSVDKDQYIEPESVTIQCDSGYGIVGTQTINCSEDGTWHPKVPKCEWVSGKEFSVFYQILKMVACSRVCPNRHL